MAVLSVQASVRVGSDVDRLERVVVHRPGEELRLITEESAGHYLFDGPVSLRAAQREHDALTRALADSGAEVVVAGDVVGEEPPPNFLYTRDLFAVVGETLVQARLRRSVRRAEGALASSLLGAVTSAEPVALAVEGGDVMVYADGLVVVGISERTSAAGAAELARRLLRDGAADEVIAAVLPRRGPFHLDLALTLVDRGVVLADLDVLDRTRAIRWRRGEPERHVARVLDALPAPRVIPAGGGSHDRAWDRGANVLAVAPGRVIAYADNDVTNRRLERAGVEVILVPGRALGKGRGGPRCLTAPLLRA